MQWCGVVWYDVICALCVVRCVLCCAGAVFLRALRKHCIVGANLLPDLISRPPSRIKSTAKGTTIDETKIPQRGPDGRLVRLVTWFEAYVTE